MPTNDERREIAARLREIESEITPSKWFHWEAAVCESWHAIRRAIGPDKGNPYDDHKEMCNRLADLIEPEPERTCKPIDPFDKVTKHIVERGLSHYYWPYKGCPECQRDFPQGSNFCPNCGARVKED